MKNNFNSNINNDPAIWTSTNNTCIDAVFTQLPSTVINYKNVWKILLCTIKWSKINNVLLLK